MSVVALYGMKGGVGKTTAAVNLAWLAARDGLETLLCDLDPQGAASWCFRIKSPRKWSARRLARGGRRLQEAIRGTDYPRLDLLPAALSYRSLDLRLAGRETGLSRILEPLSRRYALVLLDCPAALGLAAVSVLRAAPIILVPVVPSPLAVEAYRKLADFHRRRHIGESRLFPFFSMVDRRKRLHRDTCAAGLGETLRTRIPLASEVELMGVRRAPLLAFRHASTASRAFEALWSEVKALISEEPQVGPTAASPQ